METSIPPGRIGSARANAKTDESRLQSFGKPRVGRAAGPNAGRPDWSRTPDNPEGHLRALALIRHVALDMDGTIYSGQSLFKETAPFLSLLHEHGVGHSFLTNNSSKSAADHVKHLHSLGVAAKPEELFTSAHAAFEYLRETRPEIRRLFVLGTESMRQEIAAAGFALTADDSTDEPDAVLRASTRLWSLPACVGLPGGSNRANPSLPRIRIASAPRMNRLCWWIAAPSVRR